MVVHSQSEATFLLFFNFALGMWLKAGQPWLKAGPLKKKVFPLDVFTLPVHQSQNVLPEILGKYFGKFLSCLCSSDSSGISWAFFHESHSDSKLNVWCDQKVM